MVKPLLKPMSKPFTILLAFLQKASGQKGTRGGLFEQQLGPAFAGRASLANGKASEKRAIRGPYGSVSRLELACLFIAMPQGKLPKIFEEILLFDTREYEADMTLSCLPSSQGQAQSQK